MAGKGAKPRKPFQIGKQRGATSLEENALSHGQRQLLQQIELAAENAVFKGHIAGNHRKLQEGFRGLVAGFAVALR